MTHFADQTGLPEGLPRYMGNLHSHTVNSDGHWTPEQSVAEHRSHGYQFLCLSDHDLFTDYSGAFDTEDFIILPALKLRRSWYPMTAKTRAWPRTIFTASWVRTRWLLLHRAGLRTWSGWSR